MSGIIYSLSKGGNGGNSENKEDWTPKSDWWDIKSIVENDTEDYPAKAIFLMTDTRLMQTFEQNAFFNADKIVLSDGQVITENESYIIGENGLKQCSDGYKTYYAIVYLKTTSIDFSYTSMVAQFKFSKFIYFYNVERVNANSSWSMNGYTSELEAWISNKAFRFSTNGDFAISANKLQKLPRISAFVQNNMKVHASVKVNILSAPKIKKSELKNIYYEFDDKETLMAMKALANTLVDEILDLEQDLNIIPSKITSYPNLQGMKEIVELDFINATSVTKSGFCVRDAGIIKNIVRSNNYFECSHVNTGTIRISRDTLLKVIDALADYSTDTEKTYVLTLRQC